MYGRRVALGGALFALILLAVDRPAAREEPLAGWFDLAVPGGESTLAALGLTLEERAFTLPVLARATHDRDQQVRLSTTLARLNATARSSSTDVITIPAPLDASVWRDLLPPVKPPASNDLFLRLINNRDALITSYGLTTTTDSVRALMTRERDLLRFVYQQGAGAFAIVARRLVVDNGRVIVPGGPGAEAAWEALVGVSPSRAGLFLRALVTKDNGRLAWYYDAIGGLDDARLAAAWPAALPARERAAALYPAFRDPDPQWRVAEQPFRRGPVDAWMILTQNDTVNGVATTPLPQPTWELLFANTRVNRDQVTRSLTAASRGVSLPWLTRETLSPVLRERRSRYEMFRLAQRVFVNAPASALVDVAIGVAGVRQYRALVLALERMQITTPATWAAAITAARHVSDDADDHRESIVSFQGVIALLERMRHVRTINAARADELIRSLSEAVGADKRVVRSIARWVIGTLMPALPPLVAPDAFTGKTAYQSRILQALAGPVEADARVIEWEGLKYVVDATAAEHDRLLAMRALLPSPGLDAALATERPRALVDALTALVYATALGDPEGPASLSPDVAARHEFGLSATTLIREEVPWSPPEERQGNGPWHVQGALIGLDLGLSRLFLRRVADQQMPQAPSLTLNDLATLTRTAVGLVPVDLRDSDRDEIAAAINRGRERVRDARSTAELVSLAREAGIPEFTTQLLTWMALRQRESVLDVFALRDLMWLGKPGLSRDALDRWGVAGEGLDGRRVLAMPGPSPWEDYAGRSEAGQVTTQMPDLTLRLAEETARLQLPARLVPSLIAFALEDYWHDVRARFADDWPRLARQAAVISSARIHDYVAALAGGGPLRAQ